MAQSSFHIAKTVKHSRPVAGVELYTSKMDNGPIVTITGTFRGGRDTAENMMVAEVLTELFAEGTKRRSKRDIENVLESMGAAVSFSCREERISFSAKCLSRDTEKVLSIIAEEISEPALASAALKKVQQRLAGEIEQAEDSTRVRATDAFLAAAFPEGHPHHMPSVADRRALLGKVTRKDVLAHHRMVAGRGSVIIAIAGEVDHKRVSKKVGTLFKKMPIVAVPTKNAPAMQVAKATAVTIAMPGKPNVDVVIGAPVALRKNDRDYIALAAGLGILGGREGFNGRLMQIIREKMGLTYGIYAFLNGFEEGRPGYWYIWGTFGPSTLKKGVAATTREIQRIALKGVTAEELKIRKGITKGSYAIAGSATESRVVALLRNAEDGRPISYLDEYPSVMQKLTVTQVNRVLKKYVSGALVTASAGGVDIKKG